MAENLSGTLYSRERIRVGNTQLERREENQAERDSEENESVLEERLDSVSTKLHRLKDGLSGKALVTKEEKLELCRQALRDLELAKGVRQNENTFRRAALDVALQNLTSAKEKIKAVR